jgi:hypothetical protein
LWKRLVASKAARAAAFGSSAVKALSAIPWLTPRARATSTTFAFAGP